MRRRPGVPPVATVFPSGEKLLLDLVSATVRDRAPALGEAFRNAQPFPHIIIDGFLDPDFLRQLRAEFPAFDEARARNEFGEAGGKAVHERLPQLGPAYARFDQLLQHQDFLALISTITGIPKLLYDPEYIGGGTHENRHGQDLDMHIDFNYHPQRKWHRRLNLILFLNPEWKEEWGGCLELQRDPWNPEDPVTVSAAPIANRCVLFETSERSWHGFPRIAVPEDRRTEISRRSIAVYFYTEERPADEVRPEHATVYVPRHLPEHVRPGHTLSESDVAILRDLLARRDMHLRFLYEREYEHSSALRIIQDSQAYQLAWKMIAAVRKIKATLGLGRRT
jgi:hypothetical protein